MRVQIPEMLQCTPDLNSQRVDVASPVYGPLPGIYRGFCLRGKPDGRGEWIGDEGLSYTGEWRGGRQHGHGKAVAPNAVARVGEFRSGKPFKVMLHVPGLSPLSHCHLPPQWFSRGSGPRVEDLLVFYRFIESIGNW